MPELSHYGSQKASCLSCPVESEGMRRCVKTEGPPHVHSRGARPDRTTRPARVVRRRSPTSGRAPVHLAQQPLQIRGRVPRRGCRSARRPAAATAGNQRARHRHALLLAARQRAGPMVEPVAASPTRASSASARLAVRPSSAGRASRQRHLDVLERRELRQQMVELEHEADVLVAERHARLVVHPSIAASPMRDRAGVEARRARRARAAACSSRRPTRRRSPPSRPRSTDRSRPRSTSSAAGGAGVRLHEPATSTNAMLLVPQRFGRIDAAPAWRDG